MYRSFIALSVVCFAVVSNAKVISETKQPVKIELAKVVLEVQAICKTPKFEDDSFRVFFSDTSYVEVSKYEKMGYAFKLLNKNCGSFDAKVESLSSKNYETVKIQMVNVEEAQNLLKDALTEVWNSEK